MLNEDTDKLLNIAADGMRVWNRFLKLMKHLDKLSYYEIC